MKAYDTKDIRNVVLLGHGGAGKSTVVEALAFVTGVTTRMGKVADGNSISDYDKEEQKRKFSISTSVIPVEYKTPSGVTKINFLDTPGYFDFVGEVEEALAVADAAVIVVNCKAGIQPGARKAWEFCEEYNLPRFIFVTNMDDAEADFQNLLANLTDAFGTKISPLQVPIKEGGKLAGYVNVIKQKGRKWTEGSKKVDCDVPADCADQLESARGALMEAVAETSEELMEKFFDGEEFSAEEIYTALANNVADGSIVPVLLGSGSNAQGMDYLMQCIDMYFPSPDKREIYGVNKETSEEFKGTVSSDGETSLMVWKTIVDPFIGKYSLFKVMTGVLKPDTTFTNVNKETEEKGGKLFVLRGKDAIEVTELKAGDIGALSKLSVTATGDTLAPKTWPVIYNGPKIEKPYTYMAYFPVNKGEDDKVATGLAKLLEEDKTLRIFNDGENRQSLIYGIGEQQLEVIKSKLENRYKVKIDLKKPKFAYRETLRKKVENIEGKHKKQSGGHGQYGHVKMEFEPSGDLDKPYIFEERVFGGTVPKNYFPAVEKGIQECVLKGPLAGYPVVGLKATLFDGSYHPVDSSEMAFKIAANLAFKDGFMKASPVILEPIANLKVTVPESFTGDIMGDLNKRRGRISNSISHNGKQIIEAEIPMSELYGYGTDLRSMTGGIGSFEYEFCRYDQAPSDVQEAVIAAAAKEKDEE